MIEDKNLYYYGRMFNLLIDPITKVHRNVIMEVIPNGSLVLDAGCGTGELSLALRQSKDCQVVGIDLSTRMIEFAQNRNSYAEVTFLHRDATNVPDFGDGYFEFAVLCQVMHEVNRDIQHKILSEITRLAKQVVITDYNAPLPGGLVGSISRMIEATLGRDHHGNFKSYLHSGGLLKILEDAGYSNRVKKRFEFNNGCHQVILLDS
jgi:ubiquinone/menaquinone biosynthesis C-methylase UbiE